MAVSGWDRIMKDTAKTILRASLAPESLILGVAVCNFVVVWVISPLECMGYICPWYFPWSFTNEPTRLLAASCLLRTGRTWGYSAAIALCGFILLESLPLYANDYAHGILLENLSQMWYGIPFLSLHAQNLLAATILVYSAVCWVRDTSGVASYSEDGI
jgi:hypothetical protein